MEATYNLKSIVLQREPWQENNTKVIVYSSDFGRVELIARGTQKISSKLAPHLEPITLTNIMAIRGRKGDYVGGAISENCFPEIKNNLEKIYAAGSAIKIFSKLMSHHEKDERIFDLLLNFLLALSELDTEKNKQLNYDFLKSIFVFKLLSLLGYEPQLFECVSCGKKITPGNNKFDYARSGIVCANCFSADGVITDTAIKVLRLFSENGMEDIIRIKIEEDLMVEVIDIVSRYQLQILS